MHGLVLVVVAEVMVVNEVIVVAGLVIVVPELVIVVNEVIVVAGLVIVVVAVVAVVVVAGVTVNKAVNASPGALV